MILEFSNGSARLLFAIGYVNGVRKLSVAAFINGFVFEDIELLYKYKEFDDSQLQALKDTNYIINHCKSDEAAKKYVISELSKEGFKYLGCMSVEEYLDRYKKHGFN